MSLMTMAALGAISHYGMAQFSTNMAEDSKSDTQLDVIAIGAGGGILGGVILEQMVQDPGWISMIVAAVLGVTLYDYFLFEI